jgi:hypothetical protein
MSWSFHLRATHPERPSVEQVIHACPALVGRDSSLCACALPGDPHVSKIHASLDVREGRVLVRDAQSTNGTYASGHRLEPNRWMDVGSADEELTVQIADWNVRLQARRVATTTSRAPLSASGGKTVVDGTPFGASDAPTVMGSPDTGFLVSFAGPVDRISEPAQAARAALDVLRRTVVAELSKVPARDRAALIHRLRELYPEVRGDAVLAAELGRVVPDHVPAPPPGAGAAAFAALQDLSRWYVDGNQAVSTPEDIALFKERLRAGIDELVGGVVRLVGGVDHYHDEMDVAVVGASYPREPAEFARAVFEWRDEARDGAQVVRAAVLDVIVQQLGSFQATLRGVRELLNVLDPKTIAAEYKSEAEKRGPWGGLVARLLGPFGILQTYRRQYHNLASEEEGWFRVLFGKRFAEEYQAFARETRASQAARQLAPPANAPPRDPARLPSLPPAGERRSVEAPPIAPEGPPPGRGGTVAMVPALTPSAPAAKGTASAPPEARGGTVAMAPALKPGGARATPGSESNQQ